MTLPSRLDHRARSGPSPGRQRGFTLVELITVVAIIGVLAIISVVSYRKITNSSKMAEAMGMVQAIKVAQESYRAETGSYLNVSPALAVNHTPNLTGCYPPGTPSATTLYAWTPANITCGAACNTGTNWTSLTVQTDSLVRFCYTTIAGATGAAAPSPVMTLNGNAVSAGDVTTGPWFIVAALGDITGTRTYSTVMTSSWSSSIVVDSDGQ